MQEYTLTNTSLSVNRWKNEGALIAILGSLLLIGVTLVGGEFLSLLFFGAIIIAGFYIYANDKIIRNIGYNSPAYFRQGEMQLQPSQWQQWGAWETQPRFNSPQQQWQNQNVQRMQVNEAIANRL